MGSSRVTWDGSSAHLTLGGVGLEVGRVVEVEVGAADSTAGDSWVLHAPGVYSGEGAVASRSVGEAPRSSEASRSLGRMVGVYSGSGTLALSGEEARRWLEVAGGSPAELGARVHG